MNLTDARKATIVHPGITRQPRDTRSVHPVGRHRFARAYTVKSTSTSDGLYVSSPLAKRVSALGSVSDLHWETRL
jgi:hypothetical protein